MKQWLYIVTIFINSNIMLVQALIIILIILVIANIGVGISNRVNPPCFDEKEYFSSVKKLPDGSLAGLGSIPTHVGFDYVGARRVPINSGGSFADIGLTSYNKNGYIGTKKEEYSNSQESYINSCKTNSIREDPSDCGDRVESEQYHASNVEQDAEAEIDKILKKKKKNEEPEVNSRKLEDEMEGVRARPLLNTKRPTTALPQLAYGSQRDGYH